MQLVSIAIYNREGEIRRVDFKLGELNILTGKSKTGKSTVLDIVDYCLGRDEVVLPGGRIIDSVIWFSVMVQIGTGRILIARANPETARSNQAMLVLGDENLDFPKMTDLRNNVDTTVLREQLSERVGVEQYRIEPGPSRLSNPFDVSVRQALLLCFQKQTEIGSQEFLFHRQSERYTRDALIDTLPYFLGATGPEEASLRRQVLMARRIMRRAERDLSAAQEEGTVYSTRIAALSDEAFGLGLARRGEALEPIEILRNSLRPIEVERDLSDNGSASSQNRNGLLGQRRDIRARLRSTEDELDLAKKIMSEERHVITEAQIQVGRLDAIGIVPNADVDSSSCPLCTQSLADPDPTISELISLQENLRSGLLASATTQPRRQNFINELEERRDDLLEQLRVNSLAIQIAASIEESEQDQQSLYERRIFLRGRITQELARYDGGEDSISALEDLVRERQDRLSALEILLDQVDAQSALHDILIEISQDMTLWARRLGLEHSENQIRLDMSGPNVVALTPSGRRPLTRIGSAENWIGYHLVAHLGIHQWMTLHNRPVPRFVMFDQPSQAFFPEEVSDGSDVEDADWEAVRRQFQLLQDVVNGLNGQLQVIVCDHANLVDDWFQDSLIDNWRGGNALVPTDWFEDESS